MRLHKPWPRPNRHRRSKLIAIGLPAIFSMGDYVLLNTRNLPLWMVGTKKLAPLWVGPYKVLEVVNSNAYKLALPTSLYLLHLVFNISVLKPYCGTVIPPPNPIQIDGDLEYEVAEILAHRHAG